MIIKKIIVCMIYTAALVAMEDTSTNSTVNQQENYIVEIVQKLERLSARLHAGELKGDQHWLTMMKQVGKIECCLELEIPLFDDERNEIKHRLSLMENDIRTYFEPRSKQKQDSTACGIM